MYEKILKVSSLFVSTARPRPRLIPEAFRDQDFVPKNHIIALSLCSFQHRHTLLWSSQLSLFVLFSFLCCIATIQYIDDDEDIDDDCSLCYIPHPLIDWLYVNIAAYVRLSINPQALTLRQQHAKCRYAVAFVTFYGEPWSTTDPPCHGYYTRMIMLGYVT